MGMFDNLHIDIDKLPLSPEQKLLIGDDPGWQTKDLDCVLNDLYITDDGELKEFSGFSEEKESEMRTIPFHGNLRFYTSANGDWWEFIASFDNGKLLEIRRNVIY